MFQILSAEIDRIKKENDNMQIQLRPVFLFQIFSQFVAATALHFAGSLFVCVHVVIVLACA